MHGVKAHFTSHPRLQSTLGSTQDAVEGQNVQESFKWCGQVPEMCCVLQLYPSGTVK